MLDPVVLSKGGQTEKYDKFYKINQPYCSSDRMRTENIHVQNTYML